MTHLSLDRRDMFKSLLAISAAGALAACGAGQGSDAEPEPEAPAAPSGYLNATEMALIAAVAQTLIPQTDTAGAVEAGVPETLQALATDWGDDGFKTYWRNGLTDLAAALEAQSGSAFEPMTPDQRLPVLTAFDAAVFDNEIENGFYRDLKATIVQAYYMSEPGATEELAYEPVPGDWIGCVPLSDYPKNWAT